MAEPSPIPAPTSGRDRRAHVRIDVLWQVEAHSVWRLQPVTLREISAGGFSLETTAPFEPGTMHKFRLSTDEGNGQGRSVVVQATASHCALTSISGGLAIYVVGFRILALSEHASRELAALIEYCSDLWIAE